MSDLFDIHDMPIQDLRLLQRKPITDSRGYLERIFCADTLKSLIPGKNIVQINHTLTAKRGAARGMHYQYPPHAETKFISCLTGKVFDVAVDLRKNSPTFGQWEGHRLSAENRRQLFIPPGFAHGYCVLSDSADVAYKCSDYYHPEDEGGLIWNDPEVGIDWPVKNPILSEKDKAYPNLDAIPLPQS